jgi:histidinol-phosphate aminotransferase
VSPRDASSSVRPVIRAAAYVEAIRPYPVVGQEALRLPDPSGALKLDWNEATVSPPKSVLERVCAFVAERPMNWYPDVAADDLTEALSAYTGVPASCLLTFNGSDSALEYIPRTYVEPGQSVTVVAPTYDNFRVFAEACGARLEPFEFSDPLNPDLSVLDRLPGSRLVYLASPNNPTGTVVPRETIERVLHRLPQTVVIVDEAYVEFSGTSVIDLVTENPNLIVARTFSKAFGLAGFRIGYLAAHPSIVDRLSRVRVGKSVNALAQVAALAALEHVHEMHRYVRDVRKGMRLLEEGLTELGFTCHPTPANFMIVRCRDPKGLIERLKRELVYIRNLGHLPGLAGCVRVTVGEPEVCRVFLDTMERLVAEPTKLRAAA